MIKEQIEKIIGGQSLTLSEAKALMSQIMDGGVNHAQIAALLTAIKCKGASREEVAGFAAAMREKSNKITGAALNTLDVCGTGGDSSGTFNISTATAFVVAAAGVPVAKHGNRSISSKSGSAAVLMELGAPVSLSIEQSGKALKEIGITFLFAPEYHPAMKHVAPVRRDLAMKTIFNILGPLTNPAGTKRQIIGTYNDKTAQLMAEAAALLEMEKVCFICTENKFDEILLNGKTRVIELSKDGINDYQLSNESFGYPQIELAEILGDSPQYNAGLIQNLLTSSEKNAAFYVVAANAALALYVAGYSDNLKTCAARAEETILSGKAGEKLNHFIAFGKDS